MSRLKPSQVAWRLRYLVQRKVEAQSWFRIGERVENRIESLHTGPARPHFLAALEPPLPEIDVLAELRQRRLTLLNVQRTFAGGADWRLAGDGRRQRLWNFSLHYHAWLRDLAVCYAATKQTEYLDELRRWLVDWLETCRLGVPGFAEIPWNSFNIGQRLWHWREIDALVPRSFWQRAEFPRQRFLRSIAAQGEYLSQHIEWDLRGNHLFKDAVGLAVAAEMAGGSNAIRWRAQAVSIAMSQVKEQILPDGMHFERSPMYHIHVLEDLLALRELLPDPAVQADLQEACRRMAEPVRWLRHPCGRFPLFNDAAECSASSPDEMLAELAERNLDAEFFQPRGLRFFSEAGLLAWHGDPWTVFFDVGPVGPDYQPGHAHADSLTLEASFDGVPLIVDPGTFCYDDDAHRRYDRSTQAHNTVCIDETDSSEVWHIFRVGRRAEPMNILIQNQRDGFTASASHTGYDYLSGSPRHRREITQSGQGPLEIREEITGTGLHRVEGGFLLAPEWQVTPHHSGWTLNHGQRSIDVAIHPSQTVELNVVQRPWHPEFGKEVMTQRITWAGNVTLPFRVTTMWR